MVSKQKIKYIQSLKIKKYRQKYSNFIVEGEKMALELLADSQFTIENIIALETWIEIHKLALKPHFNKILTATEADLKQISNLTTPNKVFIIAAQPTPHFNEKLIENNYSLYLDGIQDPGNMGTILRIADWFSIPYVFCSETCVDVWSSKVVQASMGAFLRVKTMELPFETLKNRFPKLPIFATILRGGNIFKNTFPEQGIIVIGNEGNGVSEAIVNQTDFKIAIPGGGGAESLNAAVATGIVCAVLKNK
jgi:RNA methyltransferase, TrmH family